MTRGERNNNPGNIRISQSPWKGKITPSKDTDFETFDTPEHGIRAIAKLLITYLHHDINTIAKIINHWAPSSENDTEAYVKDVCDRCGMHKDSLILGFTPGELAPIVEGIIFHENGGCVYSQEQINAGVKMALLGT